MPWGLLFTVAVKIADYFLGRAEIAKEVSAADARKTRDNLNASLDLFSKAKAAGEAAASRFDREHGDGVFTDPNRRED